MARGIEIKDQVVGTLPGSLELQAGSLRKGPLAADQVSRRSMSWRIRLGAGPGRPEQLHQEMN